MTTELQALMDATTAANNAIIEIQQTKQAAQNLVDTRKIIQYKIFHDTNRNDYETSSSTTPMALPIALSFTPQIADSQIIIKASGNFFSDRTDGYGANGIEYYLYDGNTDISGKWNFIYDEYAGIHNSPMLAYIDMRGGLTVRNYNLRIKCFTSSNLARYAATWGQGFMEIWEMRND